MNAPETFERGGEAGRCKRCGQPEFSGHAWQCEQCGAILDSDERGLPLAACHAVLRLRCVPAADTEPAPPPKPSATSEQLDRMGSEIDAAARFAYATLCGDAKPLDVVRAILGTK